MKIYWLITLLLFSCVGEPAYAGEITSKLLYGYGSKDGQVTSEKVNLSVDYDSGKYWIDERAGRDFSQGVDFENFLGAGWKNKISASWDSSAGIIWEYSRENSDYLGSLRLRHEGDSIKSTVFLQPYMSRDGYIVKGSMVSGRLVQEFEYRSTSKMLSITTGIEF